MTAASRKILRDFWQERARTLLVALAIAIGIAGFFAVLGSWSVLTRELKRGYMATNPASAILHTAGPIDEALRLKIAADPRIADAERRRIVRGRIEVAPAKWRGLTLFVIEDFANIRVSKVAPWEGAWPPGEGEILIERDALQVARAQIGQTVRVRTAAGTEQTMTLTGTVHDPGQAQARMENAVYGYITLSSLDRLGEKPFLNQLQIVVASTRSDREQIREIARSAAPTMNEHGSEVWRIDVPEPGEHPHARIMGLLLLAMASFGLFILLLSGILVVNLMTAVMAAQVRQIGVMKALGASRTQVARIYLSQALLLGAAALIVAIPAGLWGMRELTRAQATLLNFDMSSLAMPLWVWLITLAVALAVPFLSAAYPVWKATAVPIRVALTDYGVAAGSFGRTRMDRGLARIGGGARPILLAVRNSFRRRGRVALTILTLAVGGVFFLSALNVQSSMVRTIDRLFDTRRFDLAITLGSLTEAERIEAALQDVPGIVAAEGWISTEAILSTALPESPIGHAQRRGIHDHGADEGDRIAVLALPAASTMIEQDITKGRRLRAGDARVLVANHSLASEERMSVGDRLPLRLGDVESEWTVVGISREPFAPPAAYVPLETMETLGDYRGVANLLRIDLQDESSDSVDRAKGATEKALSGEGVLVTGMMSEADSRYGFDAHMLMIDVFLIIVSAILAGVGGLGLMTTMSLGVLERRREMGVIRAIGASPAMVATLLVAEGVVIGLMSWGLGALLAWPVSKATGDFLGERFFQSALVFRFEPRGLMIWLAVSIVVSALASLIPSWQAARRPVHEALGYE